MLVKVTIIHRNQDVFYKWPSTVGFGIEIVFKQCPLEEI